MISEDIPLGKYQHYKNGKLYEVIGIALHSETKQEMIIYKALYRCEQFGDYRVWVRPKKMFLECVVLDGHHVPRFKQIKNGSTEELK